MTTAGLDVLVAAAESDLEEALRGASLCSVSRQPHQGAADVKFNEGRWYTLRDIQRQCESGLTLREALEITERDLTRRTPAGPAWQAYRDGARSAVLDVRQRTEG